MPVQQRAEFRRYGSSMKALLQHAPADGRISSGSRMVSHAIEPPATALLGKILVPVDFSSTSQKALDYAVALAERSGTASIHLMHVVEPLPFHFVGEVVAFPLTDEEAASECEHKLASLAHDGASPRLPISSAVHIGEPAPEIIAVARELRADLLIVSTHGRTGLKHLLLGSVAERIVREAPCPVLVVREREHEFIGRADGGPAPSRLRRILVATDFSPASREALRYAVRFARQLGGRITLCHSLYLAGVFATPEFPTAPNEVFLDGMREAAQARLDDLQRTTVPHEFAGGVELRMGPPLAELPALAKSGDFDLIICATHRSTGLRHASLGSIAEGLVRHAPCPVLVVRRNAPRRRHASRRLR
jgi:nucleotide-binding universal stress UspA family protein